MKVRRISKRDVRTIKIFIFIVAIHCAAICIFLLHSLRADNGLLAESGSATSVEERGGFPILLEMAVYAHDRQDWDAVSLHVARYLALSMNGHLEFDDVALSECLEQIDLKPTAFISGKYAQPFLDWFFMVPTEYWLASPIDDEAGTFLLADSQKDGKFVHITGQPFLEGYSVIGIPNNPLAIIPMTVDAEILLGTIENGSCFVEKKVEFPSGGAPVQYIWPPEFHDLDGDGRDEIWIRYNQETADGFMQSLAIFRDEPTGLSTVTNFFGVAEGIARRLPNGHVQVGYGCAADGQLEGHLFYSEFMLETLEYQNEAFIKVSERRIPHILWSDAWLDFYDLPKEQEAIFIGLPEDPMR